MLPRDGWKGDLMIKWIPYIIILLLLIYAGVTR